MEQFKRFSTPKAVPSASKPLPFSEGHYGFGSQFTLTHRIKGTEYAVGDVFTYIPEGESRRHDPYILKIGEGIGETCFLDPHGRAVILSADVSVVNTIFEYQEPLPKTVVLSEGEEYTPPPAPPVFITEGEFKEFRKGLATVLSEIAAIAPDKGERGDRGERGERGEKGNPGEPGAQGVPGETGQPGIPGEKGDKGDTGEPGEKGERGEKGDKGDKGENGNQGEPGENGRPGEKGDRGEVGPRGERGEKGDRGTPGRDGLPGKPGADGKDGKPGAKGDKGEKGERGLKGEPGAAGTKGNKGDPGEQGKPGLLSAKFPLVYDADEKTISIDEERLDKILKKILGGGKVSPQDMGWLASTGGGGKVAVYVNGIKVTPDVRTLAFTSSGNATVSASKVGGKVTVNIDSTGGGGGASGGVSTVNGLSGAVSVVGGTNISVVPTGQTLTINYTGSSVSNAVTSFNGATGAVQGLSSLNGKTGAFVINAGSGITYSMTATGLSLAVNYLKGGQTFTSLNSVDGTDLLLFQKKPGGISGEIMFTCSILNAFNSIKSQGFTFEAYPEGGSPPKSGSYFIQQSGSNSYSVGYDSVVQGIFDTYGVSTLNGKTGAVTVSAGAGLTLSTLASGISLAIHYGVTGASSAFTNLNPTNPDRLLIQKSSDGAMYFVTYSTLITKASQVGDSLNTSATYTPTNTNFVIQNTSSGQTEMVSANNVFSSIDGGMYSDAL
jgi:hypothetical protein